MSTGVSDEDLTSALTEMIADQIGDRLHHLAAELGEISDFRQTGGNKAEFLFATGRRVVVTVAMGGDV